MKTISISVITYNEENNVLPLYAALREQLDALSERYQYEIVFIDNKSEDSTREKLLQLCQQDARVKAIFNARNAGPGNSQYYGMLQTSGDCTVVMCADFQDPPQLLPRMVEAWEQGYKVVCMTKTASDENKLMRLLRTVYYKVMRKISDTEIIEHFTGFGLYDKSFIDLLRKLDEPEPFLRGIVARLGAELVTIPFTQPKRRAGISSHNFFSLYELAMRGVTAHTKAGLRLAVFFGLLVCAASFIAAIVCLFVCREALLTLGLFFLGGVQLFFVGLLGEYVVDIQRRGMKRSLVIEERRINF
jgi:glycosyltransferase involved in cell wall biosynthesis